MPRGGARKGAGRPRKPRPAGPFDRYLSALEGYFPGLDAAIASVEAENRERFPNPPSASKRDKRLLQVWIERWRKLAKQGR
jgi:hypothetical protein